MIYVKKELKPQKVFADSQDRYIAVEVKYHGKKKSLILNIYAPNGAKTVFFQELKKQIEKVNYEHLVIIGDYNGTIDLDRLNQKNKKNKNKKKDFTKYLL